MSNKQQHTNEKNSVNFRPVQIPHVKYKPLKINNTTTNDKQETDDKAQATKNATDTILIGR